MAIERDIVADRMSIGAPLATEAELSRRYGASRWAIREALAIVQNDGLLTMKRGRGGGAVISSTPGQSLAAAICGFLLYARFENSHIIQARAILDRLLFEAAARNVKAHPSKRALALLAAGIDHSLPNTPPEMFDESLALAGSGITSVMALALSRLTLCRLCLLGVDDMRSPLPDIGKQLLRLRYTQLESIIGYDAIKNAAATTEVAKTFYDLFDRFEHRPTFLGESLHSRAIASRIAQILHPGRDEKQAGVISTMLMFDAMNLRPEDEGYIGSEAHLTARYGVPRNLLREGIRILERDGFIRAEQGRSGGIKVGEADGSQIVERAIRIFEFLACPVQEIAVLAREFRMAGIESVLMETSRSERSSLAQEMREAYRQEGPNGLFLLVAHRSRNNFLIFNEKVCCRLLEKFDVKMGKSKGLDALPHVIEQGNIALSRRLIGQFHAQLI